MENSLWKRGIVLGIVLLFVGASVTPSMSGNIEKACCTNTVVNVKNRLSDQFDIPAENEVVMTEIVWIDDDGNCSLDLWLNITSPDLADNYRRALGFNESMPPGPQPVPETISFNGSQSLRINESIKENASGNLNVSVEEEIQINSSFCSGIHQQQLLSLGINITKFRTVEMCRVGLDEFAVHVLANGSFLNVNISDNNWTVSIGPSNLLASTDRASFILTQIYFIQEMLNSSGTQRYNSSWITTFYLPPDAVLTNVYDLSTENWSMDFGNGTTMTANITPCALGSPIVLIENMVVNNSNISMTDAQDLVENGFLCYKVFNIKYWKQTWGSPYCSSPCSGEDFRWGIDLSIIKLRNLGFELDLRISDDVNVNMTVSFGLELKAHMDLKTKWFKLRRFRAYMQLDGYIEINFNVSAGLNCSGTWIQQLYEWNSSK